jgi:hypothetical protein
MTIRRDAEGHFLPGASPNPGGKPKIDQEIRRAAQERSVAAIEFLGSVMNGDNLETVVTREGAVVKVPASVKDRIAASEVLLERAVGRAPVADLKDDEDGAERLTNQDLLELFARVLESAEMRRNSIAGESTRKYDADPVVNGHLRTISYGLHLGLKRKPGN